MVLTSDFQLFEESLPYKCCYLLYLKLYETKNLDCTFCGSERETSYIKNILFKLQLIRTWTKTNELTIRRETRYTQALKNNEWLLEKQKSF